MKIATWNVNSVRVRSEQLKCFLQENDIDVVLLQELKCQTEAFPQEEFEAIGYNCAVFGQKTYNGTAILSKYLIEDVQLGSQIFSGDLHARYIDAFINKCRIASVYVPNGQSPDAPAYQYKLQFLQTLTKHIQTSMANEDFVIGGDFNVALEDIDVYDPKAWKGKICCTEPERLALREILSCGLIDVARVFSQEPAYTWFDYRFKGFLKQHGLRIDYLFSSKEMQPKSCVVDLATRALERPSDHAPLIASF